MKTIALALSILCAVATAAPTPTMGHGLVDVTPDIQVDISHVASNDEILSPRGEANPIVDILNGGKVKVVKNLDDINVAKGLVSGANGLNARSFEVAEILEDGTAAVAGNGKNIHVARENEIIDVLHDGTAIVAGNAQNIHVARGEVADILHDGTVVAADNAKNINVARDNEVTDVLEEGTAIVAGNGKNIHFARNDIVDVLHSGKAIVAGNANDITAA
ncbi:hypothetical protein BGW36DRAFT_458216 [Talaromyces proteolyticus]|uniref:Uncharacterized protein n=1 Tax=Talaromyces proteolyticus TaxID=1131652 RepID=A0AAD4Q2W1_9EURO|nr:uncharacterized protein BGW36DRAFT_458216 [Talaromyces proteolyticus]KAH8704087.1 hypothetical protein BGW36DRAFT_458216 [Talaromyces proteolyticus]